MNRYGRAVNSVNLDAWAKSVGQQSEAQVSDLLRCHSALSAGGWMDRSNLPRLRAHYPGIPDGLFNSLATYVNAGKTGRDRADRLTDCVCSRVDPVRGVPMGPAPERDYVRGLAQSFGEVEMAHEVEVRLDARDQHRDRHNGIDNRARVEQAKQAALQNQDAQRRADIEREFDRHAGPQPTLYAADRRELLARGHDRIAQRIVQREVRNTDPGRRPDRGDDRRDDIALQYDRATLEDLSRDELNVAANPLLEAVDDAATEVEALQQADQ